MGCDWNTRSTIALHVATHEAIGSDYILKYIKIETSSNEFKL